MKNQDGGLKVPFARPLAMSVMFRCQNLIGSQASTHSTFNFTGPCNRHPNTKSHRVTQAQITDI